MFADAELLERLLHTHTPLAEIAVRFCAAIVLSAPIGIDREMRNKAAGMRTHLLVALAAAAFAVLTIEFAHASRTLGEQARLDPVRAVETIVTGIAFLGAGAIIRSGENVYGITTGASIWLAGSVGVACGIGSIAVAFLLTALGLLILSLLRQLPHR